MFRLTLLIVLVGVSAAYGQDKVVEELKALRRELKEQRDQGKVQEKLLQEALEELREVIALFKAELKRREAKTGEVVPQAKPPEATSLPQWTPVGILRKADFEQEGRPVYLLEKKDGTVLLHVVPGRKTALRDYVGRTISLYGQITQPEGDFPPVVHATHLAVF